MKDVLLQHAIKLNRNHKQRKWWQNMVRTMAMVVVFCTTYALILPAITMEQEALCGKEAHTHEDSCYTTQSVPVLECGLGADAAVVHSHSDLCRDVQEALICSLPERAEHTHSEACYMQEAVCGYVHEHGPACIGTQRTLICGQEEAAEHVHSEACTTELVLTCGLEEREGHTHTDSCGNTKQTLVCTEQEVVPHVHADTCYQATEIPCQEDHEHGESCVSATELVLTCTATEDTVHTHLETCYQTEQIPCENPETAGHTHSESCYERREISCTAETQPAHIHEDTCYSETEITCDKATTQEHVHTDTCFEKQLICGQEEVVLHTHEESCYDAEQNLICQLPQVVAHTHMENCLVQQEQKVLTCQLEEHTHGEACYPTEAGLQDAAYICGFGVHSHTINCTDGAGNLTCTIPEHAHDLSCVVEGYDLTADVETEEQWKESFASVTMTGHWPTDVLAVAKTQLDYKESTKNVVQTEDGALKGYARYGAWYGKPYEDWDALFAAFCLHYAGVEEFPVATTAQRWETELIEHNLYRMPPAYTPKPGDLAFLDLDQGDENAVELPIEADQVAIVAELIAATEDTPAQVKLILGNRDDRVQYVTYRQTDPVLIGYGELPANNLTVKTFTGEDFEVTVTYGRDAALPQNAELTVQEILPGTEEYETYYRQSVESLGSDAEGQGLSFARFFDISFLADGMEVEPEAPVEVQIRYNEAIPVGEEETGFAIHFAQEGIEILDADTYITDSLTDEKQSVLSELMERIAKQEEQVDTFVFTQESFSVVGTVLAANGPTVYVWLDGTCGGLMAYTGSTNRRQQLQDGVLPMEWDEPTRYDYTLRGWYDVTHSKYYPAGATVGNDVGTNTVFYADWVVARDDIGYDNGHTVDSLDTQEFITTHVFDYNALFNVQSTNASVQSSNSSHREDWRLIESGSVSYKGATTLNFIFRDHDSNNNPPHLTHPSISDGSSIRNEPNSDQLSAITPGIYTSALKNLLFTPSNAEQDFVIGREYLGQGNYLYQYQGDPTQAHYGYYYYDSFKNAASYNASEERFYIYDYTEYTQDTVNNGYNDTNADFLPLNMPRSGEDLSDGVIYASRNDQSGEITNFFFGVSSNVHFFLPNDAGERDANGNYKNKSTTGDHMIFEFFGDDDVWVLVDGEVLLDIGGIHMVRGGKIDFSEGKIYTAKAGSDTEYDVKTFTLEEGPHDLTILYLERGSSMSNCAIYFNLAPRYGLDLTKTDFTTGERLPGVTFAVYNDEACTQRATLWNSHEEAALDSANKPYQHLAESFTTDANGIARMWGFVAGKTYYIKETAVPAGYEPVEALIRVTLNNHGTDVAEVTVIRNPNKNTAGFEVISNAMDKEKHQLSISLTNRKKDDAITAIRAEKNWDSSATVLKPVQVYLMANGVRKGDPVTLSVDNAWGHSWLNLPAKDASGQPITYTVDEMHLPGYNKESIETTVLKGTHISWAKVGALDNNAVFLLRLNNGNVLTANGATFGSVAWEYAKETANAYWTATAYQDGFRISRNGTHLTFNGSNFYLTSATTEGTGTNYNQTFYYDGTYLFVMANNNRYCLGTLSGNSLTPAAQPTGIYKQVVTPDQTTVFTVTNSMIPEQQQKDLRVRKLWVSEEDKIPASVQVHLKKNGKIVATLELTKKNDWTAIIEGLDQQVLANKGYTLEEVVPFGFAPEYGQIQDISVDNWIWDNGSNSLVTGRTYSFQYNGRALADDNGTPRLTYYSGTPAKNQQWQVVEYSDSNGSFHILRNVATGMYLQESNQRWYMTGDASRSCEVRRIQGRLQYYPQKDNNDGWSIRVDGNGNFTDPAWGYQNGTQFTTYWNEYREEYLVTVTNTYGVYVLPNTGGVGTQYHTFGGLLMIAFACVYSVTNFGRKRQKGGARRKR